MQPETASAVVPVAAPPPYSAAAPVSPPPKPAAKPRRRHFLTALFVLVYLVFLILPWATTCILSIRPKLTTSGSYNGTQGQYTPSDLERVESWMRAVPVLNTIAAVMTVPVLSAVLGHVAVVVMQRRVDGGGRVDLRELLAMADATWASLGGGRKWPGHWFVWAGTFLIFIGVIVPPLQSLLVTTSTIRMPTCNDLYEKNNTADECSTYSYGATYTTVGLDPEPAVMALMPLVEMVARVGGSVGTVNQRDTLSNAWIDNTPELNLIPRDTLYRNYSREQHPEPNSYSIFYPDSFSSRIADADLKVPYFASSLPSNTNTGVLREHAMRMNSSFSCQPMRRDEYPSECPGTLPFYGSFEQEGAGALSIRFCAPGAYNVPPWSISRDRQDLEETMYVDIFVPYTANRTSGSFIYYLDPDVNYNITLHCTGNTTRGYFELPSYHNNGTAGPLLEKWPSFEELQTGWNDYSQLRRGVQNDWNWYPGTMDNLSSITASLLGSWAPANTPFWWYNTSSPSSYLSYAAPGPLLSSLLSMLGNNTFFSVASNPGAMYGILDTTPTITNLTANDTLRLMCMSGLPLPLTRLGESESSTYSIYLNDTFPFELALKTCDDAGSAFYSSRYDADDYIGKVVLDWFLGLNSSHGWNAMELAMYLANEAVMTASAEVGSVYSSGGARKIYKAEGTEVTKPHVGRGAVTGVSVLVGIEALVLVLLLGVVYWQPTMGRRFEAVSVLILGARLKEQMAGDVPRLGMVGWKERRRLEDVNAGQALRDGAGDDNEIEMRDQAAPEYEPRVRHNE